MKPNFSGQWIADLSRSKFLGPNPKSLAVVITHTGDHLYEELLITRQDNTQQRVLFECSMSAGEATLDGQRIRCGLRWNNDELIVETWTMVATREFHFCDCWSLAADGQILSMEHRGDDLAGQYVVFQRQSEAQMGQRTNPNPV